VIHNTYTVLSTELAMGEYSGTGLLINEAWALWKNILLSEEIG
jgi:hypothetical protein